jgi:pyridoxamine 5'-phosphate oxidase
MSGRAREERDEAVPPEPLGVLGAWIEEAGAAGSPRPRAMALATAGEDGPTLRTVSLKRLEPDALVFTTALWTRKAREMLAEPKVALLFHWPELGRQAQVFGTATIAERALAEELFGDRDLDHQLQTVVSRQGEPIEDLTPLRELRSHLAAVGETPPPCPEDWGAIRVRPQAIELMVEADDRLHERRLYERDGDAWSLVLLSP